jgi:hypothetical protein
MQRELYTFQRSLTAARRGETGQNGQAAERRPSRRSTSNGQMVKYPARDAARLRSGAGRAARRGAVRHRAARLRVARDAARGYWAVREALTRRSDAAIAAAAAPGSGAPVIGRPITSRSEPACSASSGVATRA